MLNLECLPRIRIDCEYTGVLRSSGSPNPNPKTLSFAFTRKLFGNSPSEALQLLSSGQPFAGPTTIVEAAMATPGPSSSEEPPLRLPSPDEIRAQDIFNNCAVRTAVSGVMGGGMGIFMGMLFGALETPVHAETMTARQNFVHAARTMSTKSVQMAKTFSVMGAIFAGTECVFEKARARHDSTNTVLAGCATGGSMSARAGPQAACLGCAGFAAFSVVIEKIFDRHN